MTIEIAERVTSRSWSNGSLTMEYIISGSADEQAVKAALLEQTEQTYNGLRRDDNASIEPLWVNDADGADEGMWEASVQYDPPTRVVFPPKEVGDSTFSFDTSGGTQHVTQSLQTISKTGKAGSTAPDFKGGIGVTKDSVEGVDITVPVYAFSETHYLSNAAVTDTYKAQLFGLTGKVNSGPFRGLSAGECLFLGASGSQRGESDWEITFKFAGSPNKTNIQIGDLQPVPAKKGWEYLWVKYSETEDTAAKAIVQRPIAAYVEKVYEQADFGGLGIGA